RAPGIAHSADGYRLTVDLDAAVTVPHADQAFHELGTARANEPCKTQDFTASEVETRILDDVADAESGDGKHRLSRSRHRLGRKQVGKLAPDHGLRHLVFAHFAGACHRHPAAIAEDGDPVGNLRHFVKFV